MTTTLRVWKANQRVGSDRNFHKLPDVLRARGDDRGRGSLEILINEGREESKKFSRLYVMIFF